MKVFIKTYGCKSNISDSEAMAGLLKKQGHDIVNSEAEADYIVVNSCSVKNATQGKELHYIREIVKEKKVIVGGCLTKTIDIRKFVPEVESVFDTNSITKLPSILETPHDEFSEEKESERLNLPIIRSKEDIGIVPIGQGCLNMCTFCATKLARGHLISYRIGDIKRAVEQCVKDGCKIIRLTSQDTGCYGLDINTTLPELLNELVEIEGDFLIWVGMMNPWHAINILDPLIESYKTEKIKKFIHIPVQSGSDKVLIDMKRIHKVETFKEIVAKFREAHPDIHIATDIIVGYPTEEESDFQETVKIVQEIKPEVINVSKFSSRKGTEAAKLKPLTTEEVKRRSKIISDLII